MEAQVQCGFSLLQQNPIGLFRLYKQKGRKMKIRKILYAEEGKVLTDGKTYGTQIFLADCVDENSFYEISREEYEEKLAAEMEVSEQ